MATIKKIAARQVLDGSGTPTIEATLTTSTDLTFTATGTSGKSIGQYEGKELRDINNPLYNGLGVYTSVTYINQLLGPKIVGADLEKHEELDRWLLAADSTKDYSKLGVNTISVLSQLLFKAAAANLNMAYFEYANYYLGKLANEKFQIKSFPIPIYTLINGGKHGVKNLDFQEFSVIFTTTTPYSTSLEYAVTTFKNLETIFNNKNYSVSVSDEGGYTPNLYNNTEAFELIKEALILHKLQLSVNAFLSIDCASTFYFRNNKFYIKESSGGFELQHYLNFISDMVKKYNILLIEDPMPDDKFDLWQKLDENLRKQIYIVADDLVAGSFERLKKMIHENVANGVVIKFNQTATITRLFEIINIIKKNNLKLVVSQRLSESIDPILADIAVGVGADFVKFGPPNRGERTVKYNRLSELDKIINKVKS